VVRVVRIVLPYTYPPTLPTTHPDRCIQLITPAESIRLHHQHNLNNQNNRKYLKGGDDGNDYSVHIVLCILSMYTSDGRGCGGVVRVGLILTVVRVVRVATPPCPFD